MLGSDMHPALPLDWGVEGHTLNYTQAHIAHEAIVDSIFPVEGDHGWAVHRDWLHCRVNMELQWRAVLQEWEGLVLTYVE